MTYSCEELDGKDIDLSFEISQVDQVSLSFQNNWDSSKIFQ
jgi:hypothetical protein